MNILITGGTGFVGGRLTRHLLARGHSVTAIGRRARPAMPDEPNFRYVAADTTHGGHWQSLLPEHQVIINLAGKSIFTRWTERAKQDIMKSRILTTRHIVEGLAPAGGVTLCNASAVGYYGDCGDVIVTEDSPPGNDFLAQVGIAWEREAARAAEKGARVVLTRFGIVLDKGGGAMAKMTPAFRSFLGGPLGSGVQWFPWIHMADLVAAFEFVIANESITGPVNFCAPEPVRNADLTRILAEKVSRPAWLPAPAFMLRLVMGELGQSLLNSQRAVPAKLTAHGFHFDYPDLTSALDQIIAS
ncbi:MAG: epimerase [Desulfatitalea sp. BRH_c12]|nr:MAG: epimerase [Desulfatitalea sp. BRH_c12]